MDAFVAFRCGSLAIQVPDPLSVLGRIVGAVNAPEASHHAGMVVSLRSTNVATRWPAKDDDSTKLDLAVCHTVGNDGRCALKTQRVRRERRGGNADQAKVLWSYSRNAMAPCSMGKSRSTSCCNFRKSGNVASNASTTTGSK